MDEKPYLVIGCIDSYGAIHYQAIYLNDRECKTHSQLWPQHVHKRWRFLLSEWSLEKSPCSKGNLTQDDVDAVYTFVRKKFKPPLWVIQGEEWEAIGRARSGKEYDRYRKRWERILARKNRKKA